VEEFPMRKLVVMLALGAFAALTLAACGSSSSSSSTTAATTSSTSTTAGGGGAAQSVAVSAVSGSALAYQQKTLSAKAGNVSFNFTNPQSLPHNFCLQTSSGQQLGCSGTETGGASDTLSVNLKPGGYTFYCNVDSHEQAGMKGALTVK
jgi:plastocyanin